MNQIFKVVYSASKQCYVVTSEFAKSNGKKVAIVAAALLLTSGVHVVNAVDTIDGPRIKRLEIQVRELRDKVSNISAKIESTNNEQININKQKSEANESAITELSKKVNALGAGTGTTGTKDQEQDSRIQSNTDELGKVEGKIATAKTEAINEAGTKADEKVTAAKTDLEGKIATAKTEAITEAGTKAEEKINEAKTELTGNIATAKTDLEGKIATAKTEAITEASTKAEEKITTAKIELETKISTAKDEAIATAISDADGKLAAAKQALEAKDAELTSKVTNLETKYNSATDIKATNERFEKLENDVDGNADAIDANTKAIDKNTDEIDEAKKILVAHDTRLDELKSAIDETVDDIAGNGDAIKDNAEKIKLIGEGLKETTAAIKDNADKIQAAGEGLKAVTEAIGDLDKKIDEDTKKAKDDAVVEAGTKVDEKVNAAKTELTEKITEAKTAATVADAKAAKAQEAAEAAAQAATDKSATAKTEAIAEAGTQADAKIKTAKEAIATDIETAKNAAITKAGENAEAKITAARTALETKFQGLDNTTVKLEKYDKDIAALQATEKAHDARITTVEKDVKVVGANAAALAALKPLQYNPGQTTQIMAGVGTYRGQSAVALGAAHYTSENLMYHAGVSFGNGSGTMANAGITIGFGSGETAKAESPKVAQLQSAVDRLTAENEQVKAALYDIYAKLQAK